jgi:hypothetical protein
MRKLDCVYLLVNLNLNYLSYSIINYSEIIGTCSQLINTNCILYPSKTKGLNGLVSKIQSTGNTQIHMFSNAINYVRKHQLHWPQDSNE